MAEFIKWSPTVISIILATFTPHLYPYYTLYWLITVPVTYKGYVKLTDFQSSLAYFTIEIQLEIDRSFSDYPLPLLETSFIYRTAFDEFSGSVWFILFKINNARKNKIMWLKTFHSWFQFWSKNIRSQIVHYHLPDYFLKKIANQNEEKLSLLNLKENNAWSMFFLY